MHRRLAAEPSEAAPRSSSPVERPLGRTGQMVLPFSLGGEGVLRTTGRSREAVPVILEALRLGVRYCDTAPAYQQSQDYYGAAFREAGSTSRRSIFLASKTHDRSRDGSLRLLQTRCLGTCCPIPHSRTGTATPSTPCPERLGWHRALFTQSRRLDSAIPMGCSSTPSWTRRVSKSGCEPRRTR